MRIYKRKEKLKNIILIACFVILLILIGIAIFQKTVTYEQEYEFITSSRMYNPDIINAIEINEMNCAYDAKTNTWFFPQDLKDKDMNVLMKTSVTSDLYNVSLITNKKTSRKRKQLLQYKL